MKSKGVGITQKYTTKYREALLTNKRNQIIKVLVAEGFSYGEISEIVRLNKSNISRMIRNSS